MFRSSLDTSIKPILCPRKSGPTQADFRKTKAAVKLHTLLDLRGSIPAFIHISDGKLHDVKVMDLLLPEAGAFYVMDRAYLDFARLHALHQACSFFVLRAKSNTQFRRFYSHPADRSSGVICDQTIVLTGVTTATSYPDKLRRIKFHDGERGKTLVFLTNNFTLPALTIAELYRSRWQVELFFKWTRISQVSSIFSAARRRFCYKNHEVVAYMERRIWHTRWVNRNRGAFGSFLTVD